ncbi:hypothetical protein JHK82_029576 [Glycine max]|nr:hypothetical protein JHK85_030214 [Glycine max]KAG5005551.1 hypothetical protein JHK86_029690 [Glycine max]KAG5128741.1 hypothetical protein JHK82_029576 [Glycine max]KAG5153348.1 hypothetical protein JHK84_029820 [Glycine max]
MTRVRSFVEKFCVFVYFQRGFTTYAERRIVEAVQGEQRATLNIGIGWRGLNEDVERFKDNLEFTKLKNNQEGIDPDNVYSQVPYEKGFQFLWRIERQNQIDLVLWTKGTGIPPDAYEPESTAYKTIVSLANEFTNGRMKLLAGSSTWTTYQNPLKLLSLILFSQL